MSKIPAIVWLPLAFIIGGIVVSAVPGRSLEEAYLAGQTVRAGQQPVRAQGG